MQPIDEYLLSGLSNRLLWLKDRPKIVGVLADPIDPLLGVLREIWPQVTLVDLQATTVAVDGVVAASIWAKPVHITEMNSLMTTWIKPGGWMHWVTYGGMTMPELNQQGVWPDVATYLKLLKETLWCDAVLDQQLRTITYKDDAAFHRDCAQLCAQDLPVLRSDQLSLTLVWLHAWRATDEVCISIDDVKF